MFWADAVAQELKKRKLPLEWVDDMKTPSGKVHVGALRGVVVHDLAYKALLQIGVKAKYTYVFEDHDPMDSLPIYLPKEYEKYMGMPLFKVPSPEKGFKNYAEYYALDFKKVFNVIGCNPEIIWVTNLYKSGKMNASVKECLDKAKEIRKIYEETYKKPLPENWYPFQLYCPNCEKVSTTKVIDWDGEHVSYVCNIDQVDWTQGCGAMGKASPFSDEKEVRGKLSWKVEWPVKWRAIGVTVEGGGKDHMTAGGSYDLSSKIAKRILHYQPPYPLPYEFFLVGGAKMSSSKGRGTSASDMLEILPVELLRFLMVRTNKNQAINFDPAGDTIPHIFDEYQKAAKAYFSNSDKELARIFELSQIGEIKKVPTVRFSTLAQWVQMPNMGSSIKKEGLEEWAKYAKVWIERFAPESEKFTVQKELPEGIKNLSVKQKEFLQKASQELKKEWNAEDLQKQIYEWAKEIGITSKEAFSAIYLCLIGKDHGPKAGWIILSLEKEFVKKRFVEVASNVSKSSKDNVSQHTQKIKSEVFSIDKKLAEIFPSISIGIAIIKDVSIDKSNNELEKEKEKLLQTLGSLTTEQLGEYTEIVSYRKLYKATGIDWHSHRPSPEALLRRVALKKGLYKVNTCVDAYNLVVMKHRVSIGAFDFDNIAFPTSLRFAKEGEEILLLGDSEPTRFKEGEVAYFDKTGGFNMDFNYRDSQRTSVQLTTKNLYINVDGVFAITPEQVEQVLTETCDMITKYCGGKVELAGVQTAS